MNHCYLILIHESIDRTYEPHLIVHLCYLRKGSQSAFCIKFIELMPHSREVGEVMFNLVQDLLIRCGLDLEKLLAIAINDALCMMDVHQGVVARLCILVPYLIGTHCVVHKEALAAKDANKNFPQLNFIDKDPNKV